MNKLQIIIALTLVANASCVNAVEYDKKLHVGASALIASSSQLYFDNQAISLSTCAAAGIGKELYDEARYGGFSNKDLIADAIGCVIGTYTIKLVDWSIGLSGDSEQYSLNFTKSF